VTVFAGSSRENSFQSVGLSVGLSVGKVYCGKTADSIGMPFGVVSGVGRKMGVLDGGGDRRRESGSFEGEFGTSHCNHRDGHALFPNYFKEDLFIFFVCISPFLQLIFFFCFVK